MATSPSYFGNYSNEDQPTLNTVANYIVDARTLLQDTILPYRYDDPSLLIALNIALLTAYRIRADLFIFNLAVKGQVQAFTAVDDTYVDIEPQFRSAILYGICSHALARDQEDVQDIRASAFGSAFTQGLIGRGGMPPVSGGSGPNPGQGQ